MSFLSGLLDPGNQHLAGQVKGTGFRVDQAAYGTVLPQFENLSKMGMNNLNAYGNYLNSMTSSSPTTRMAAASPAIADITAQSEGAKSSIQDMPRGGEKNYLIGEADISKSGQISSLLNNLYTQAQQAKGSLGSSEVGQSQSGAGLYSSMENTAGGLISGGGQIQTQNNNRMFQTIMNLASMAAMA
jgi:hypothetical protein